MTGIQEVAANEHVRYVPAAALRPFVPFWTGYRQTGGPPAVHKGLPSPYLTVIFTLDDPLVIAAHPDPAQPPGSFETLVGGLHTSPALISNPGRQSGIQLALTPLGARALLGLPAAELAGMDVHGSDVLGGLAGRIRERLQELPSWPDRFAYLEQQLADLASLQDGRPGISPDIGWAWDKLLATRGGCSISELAAQTGWSDRHLRGRFRAEIGLGPKEAARVIRFDRARRVLLERFRAGARLGLADLAVAFGYADQPHLDREFRQLAGCAPTTWLAQEFRNVQVGGASPLAE